MNQDWIKRLENKFCTYNNNLIDCNTIFNFIKQTKVLGLRDKKEELLIKGFLNILSNIVYIDKCKMQYELEKLLAKILLGLNEYYAVIKYGQIEDSSRCLVDYLQEKTSIYSIKELDKALDNDLINTVIFLDDGMNSGHQMVSIFQEYMGVVEKKRATYENHVKKLGDEKKKKFQKKNIIIGFIFFNEKAKKYVLTELKKLGFHNVKIFFNYSFSPKIEERNDIFGTLEEKEVTINALQVIGLSLLQDSKMIDRTMYKERWSKKRIRKSALGYNDAQQLIVFDYNVPTYTLPALWGEGMIKGSEWKGLFCRRD